MMNLIDMETHKHVQLCVNVFNDQLNQYSSLHCVLLPLPLFLIDFFTFSSSCRQCQGETDVCDSSDQDELEVIGEKLLALVQDMEPTHCADITGEVVVGVWYQNNVQKKRFYTICGLVMYKKKSAAGTLCPDVCVMFGLLSPNH